MDTDKCIVLFDLICCICGELSQQIIEDEEGLSLYCNDCLLVKMHERKDN